MPRNFPSGSSGTSGNKPVYLPAPLAPLFDPSCVTLYPLFVVILSSLYSSRLNSRLTDLATRPTAICQVWITRRSLFLCVCFRTNRRWPACVICRLECIPLEHKVRWGERIDSKIAYQFVHIRYIRNFFVFAVAVFVFGDSCVRSQRSLGETALLSMNYIGSRRSERFWSYLVRTHRTFSISLCQLLQLWRFNRANGACLTIPKKIKKNSMHGSFKSAYGRLPSKVYGCGL